jgi:hypothetical protein
MTDMGPLRCSRFLKIFFMFMLTITPILASRRDIILFLEDEEVKEGAQGELGAEDDNSLDSGVLKEDSDEWDEFGIWKTYQWINFIPDLRERFWRKL